MEHYSSRLKRNFQDDDLLLVNEALEIVSANSVGIAVPRRHLSDQVNLGNVHPRKSGHFNLYWYSEVKDMTYKRGPGRHRHQEPTPNAERQRKFRERQAQLKKVS